MLNGDCTDEQVGLFVACVSQGTGLDLAIGAGADIVVDALLAEEVLIVAGGLRVHDTDTGVAVHPGCCAGLEDWRDWTQLPAGGSIWSGHDPSPEVEILGDRLRVWQDGGPGRHEGRRADAYVDASRSALPGLLVGVRRDLVGFLGALAAWTVLMGLGRRGPALTEAVDRHFALTAGLDLPIM